jgi:hypothetical protein
MRSEEFDAAGAFLHSKKNGPFPSGATGMGFGALDGDLLGISNVFFALPPQRLDALIGSKLRR